jgi:thiosulfate/3-mercaptopyruvate sulfurtransferase
VTLGGKGLKNIISTNALLTRLGDPNLVLLDCRYSLANKMAGKEAYQLSHIPDAIYCDLEEQMSGTVTTNGGRHPLPNLEQFATFLENAGISNKTTVVAYDNGEGSYAGRLWWLLKYIGHEEVYVLNGGFAKWYDAGFPVDQVIPHPVKGYYHIQLNESILASYEEVKGTVEGKKQAVLIDSREARRYKGLEEPIDKIAGRIPGALNKYWNDGFENGQFKSLEEQKTRFSDINKDDQVIVYCGSGVTATPNYLILDELGFKNVKLYVGSYSDWVSYSENPIEKG